MNNYNESNELQKVWDETTEYKCFYYSWLYMILHPKDCLRLLKFAIKIFSIYGLRYN